MRQMSRTGGGRGIRGRLWEVLCVSVTPITFLHPPHSFRHQMEIFYAQSGGQLVILRTTGWVICLTTGLEDYQ